MKKYLISGIGPSHSGVGYLMHKLLPIAHDNGFEVIYPKHEMQSLRANPYNLFFIIKELYQRYKDRFFFQQKINTIKNSEIVLIHPQTIGLQNFISLIAENSITKMYVMDNSFFCMRSYNTLHGQECLQCLANLQEADVCCTPFPNNNSIKEYLIFQKKLMEYSPKIIFYTQNTNQSNLVKQHFGDDIKVEQVGLQTGEVFENNIDKPIAKQYDVVFHAANVEAKGLFYFIELAKKLPSFSFFIPYNSSSFKSQEKMPSNIVLKSMQWHTGLKEIVTNARLVLCPSLWSAPIEGAVLKSIHYNGNVGVVDLDYNFGSELPGNTVLKLSINTKDASQQIDDFLATNQDLSQKAKEWLNDFHQKECDLSALFRTKSIEEN